MMKKILKVSLSAGLLFTIPAQAASFDFKYVYAGLFDQTNPDSLAATVHFGSENVECLIDTGARFTFGKEFLLKNAPKIGEVVGGGIAGMQRTADLVQARVIVGDWVHPSGVVGRTDLLPKDCLIGNDFFLNNEFTIDFDKKTFSTVNSFSKTTFPLTIYINAPGGHFGFSVKIGDQTVPTLFDTGATDTVFDIDFVEAHPERFEFIREIDVQEGSNQTIKAGEYYLKSMTFPFGEVKNIKVYVLSLKPLQEKIPDIQAIIGLGQIKNFNWYINTKSAQFGIY